MKNVTRLICTATLLTGALFANSAFACTATAWVGAETGGASATGDWLANDFARVSGFCSLQLSGVGQVHDTSPAGEATMGGRFMFLPNDLGGTPQSIVIYEAFSDDAGTTSVFTISFNGTHFILATDSESTSVAADTTHWNMVAFFFDNDGSSKLWISSDPTYDISTELGAPHGSIPTSGAASVASIMLGMPDGLGTFTGSAQFDDYESTRSSQPGMPALIGDGNNDGVIDSVDFLNVLDELFKADQGEGQSDCNLDGKVDSVDFLCILDALFAG